MVQNKRSGCMNITHWDFNFDTSSIDIYVSGCKEPHCEGCHNSELWDFNVGMDYKGFLKDILARMEMYDGLIDNVSVMGGEPLDQDLDDLFDLIAWLDSVKSPNTKIWLYTRYPLMKVPDEIKGLTDFIKSGPFVLSKVTNGNRQYGIKLASSNQKVYKRGVDYGF